MSLFGQPLEGGTLPEELQRMYPGLEFVPPLPPPPWRKLERTCFQSDCSHRQCLNADQDARGSWYAEHRRQPGAEFDASLRYPNPAEYLEKIWPFGENYRALPGRPWLEGPLAKPEPGEQAREFILRNPEIIKYLHSRAKYRLAEEHYDLDVHPEAGPCYLIPTTSEDKVAKMGELGGVQINMPYHRLAALVKDIEMNKYTKERALKKNMEGSCRCHRKNCINPNHRIWEHKDRTKARGSSCLGWIKTVHPDGNVTYKCACQHGVDGSLNTTCVVITRAP